MKKRKESKIFQLQKQKNDKEKKFEKNLLYQERV